MCSLDFPDSGFIPPFFFFIHLNYCTNIDQTLLSIWNVGEVNLSAETST